MRKTFLMTVASVALAATAVYAADDVMASRYGNTTVTTDAKGVVTNVYYSADHTFSAKSGDQTSKGTWKLDNGKVCLTSETAPPAGTPNPICLPIAAHKVGDSWTTGEGDQKRSVKL